MKLCGWKTRDMFDQYNGIDAGSRPHCRSAIQQQPYSNKTKEYRSELAKLLHHNECPRSQVDRAAVSRWPGVRI